MDCCIIVINLLENSEYTTDIGQLYNKTYKDITSTLQTQEIDEDIFTNGLDLNNHLGGGKLFVIQLFNGAFHVTTHLKNIRPRHRAMQ